MSFRYFPEFLILLAAAGIGGLWGHIREKTRDD